MFNFNHLYYFYVAANLNGVTAASKELNTSQSSVSAQIKILEASLKRALFRKVGRQVELTDEGHKIFAYCRQIFEPAADLASYVAGSSGAKRGKVSIGVSPEIERPFIANVIGTAIKKSSQQNRPVISMISHSEDELRRSLKLGKSDFIISDSPVYDGDLEVRAVYSMPVVFFISQNLAEALGIKPKDSIADALKKSANQLALPTNKMRLRQESDLFLQKKKVKFSLVFETDILASIVRSVIDGVAAGLIPLPYILKEARQGTVKIINTPEGLWQHKIYLITNKNMQPSVFLDQVLAVFESEMKFLKQF